MKIIPTTLGLQVLFLAPTAIHGRRKPVSSVPQRDADNDAFDPIRSCRLEIDGTYGMTTGASVVSSYKFQMEYDSSYDPTDLFEDMNREIGDEIVASIVPDCRRRFLLGLDEVVAGLDASPNYHYEGSCSSNSGNECGVYTGGLKVYMHSGRNLVEDGIMSPILSFVKDTMDSGRLADSIEGIVRLTWEDLGDGEPNEEKEDEDEVSAEKISDEILEEQVVAGSLDQREESQAVVSSDSAAAVGWTMMGLTAILVTAIGYKVLKRRRLRDRSQDVGSDYVSNILQKILLEPFRDDRDAVEVTLGEKV